MERRKTGKPKQVEEEQVTAEAKIRWVNNGGLFRMKDGRVIQRKEKFLAAPSEIPEAFRDVIKPMEELPVNKPLPIPPGGFKSKERSEGLFDIVDAYGRVINENPMTEAEVKEVLSKLN